MKLAFVEHRNQVDEIIKMRKAETKAFFEENAIIQVKCFLAMPSQNTMFTTKL